MNQMKNVYEEIEKELDQIDDFALNDIIDIAFITSSQKTGLTSRVPDVVLLEALRLWSKRHPFTSPPCFAKIEKPVYQMGPSMIYEWPQA